MTKLVIGANGFLGSHVTRLLVGDGHAVRAMVRPTANTRSIDGLAVERFHGDIFDDGTRNVLEIASQATLRRFVYTSSYVTGGRRRGRRGAGADPGGRARPRR